MKKYKILIFLVITTFFSLEVFSQRVMTDGTVTYSVSVISGKDQPGIADAFDGASLTVWMKGNLVRTDLKSNLRLLSIFYNAKDQSAVMLKESGAEKYMINLSPAQWDQYNHKTKGIRFEYLNDSKVIAGYNGKKAVGTLRDGSKIVVYYAVDLKPLSPGYEDAFNNLQGLPLEYEMTTGNIVVRYTAISVQTTPVIASRFDLPKSGYKMLDYRQ